MAQWWHVRDGGRTTGPFATAELTTALLSGKVSSAALLWESGQDGWRPVADCFPEFARAPKAGVKRKAASPLEPALLAASSVVFVAAISAVFALAYTDALQAFSIGYRWFWGAVGGAALVSLGIAAPLWWRAATRLRDRSSEASGAIYIVAVIVSLLSAAMIAMILRAAGSASEMVAALAELDAYEFSYAPEEKSLTIVGSIGPRFDSRMKAALRTHDIRRIEITSEGGLVMEAMRAARFVERAKITVVARDQCDSACIIVLMAGAHRQADYYATLGFHATAPILDSAPSELNPDLSDDYLVARGVPKQIVEKARRMGPRSIYHVPAVDLLQDGALTEVLDGETPLSLEGARAQLELDRQAWEE